MVDTGDYEVTTLSDHGPKVMYSVKRKSTGDKRFFSVPIDDSGIDYEYRLSRTIRDLEQHGAYRR